MEDFDERQRRVMEYSNEALDELRREVRRVEEEFKDAFAELGPGAVVDLKRAVDCVLAFLELVDDPGVGYTVKLADAGKTVEDLDAFRRFYADKVGKPAELVYRRLREIVDSALSRVGRRMVEEW